MSRDPQSMARKPRSKQGLFSWLRRRPDPIDERKRDLTRQIEELEARIKSLGNQAEETPSLEEIEQAIPAASPTPGPQPTRRDPVFETVSQGRLHELQKRAAHLNQLGTQKFDLPAAWQRLTDQFSSPKATNPKLVDLLAAGSLQGMRPLRYERRIARRRFLLFLFGLLLLLWGLFAGLVRN